VEHVSAGRILLARGKLILKKTKIQNLPKVKHYVSKKKER
jgi:hypothetical protein